MKVTKKITEFVKTQAEYYCRLMKIPENIDIVLDMPLPANNKHSGKSWYGVTYAQDGGSRHNDLLFLNVAKHPDRKSLQYTLVHELVHVKHPRLKHGKKFDKIVGSYFNNKKKGS
jgi:hypothetical protein